MNKLSQKKNNRWEGPKTGDEMIKDLNAAVKAIRESTCKPDEAIYILYSPFNQGTL